MTHDKKTFQMWTCTLNSSTQVSYAKRIIFTLFILFVISKTQAQTICDSLYVTPDTVYINQLTDTAVYVDLTYTGSRDLSYAECFIFVTDSSDININQGAVTHGISGPFTYSKWNGYEITYNNPNIATNTVVNGIFQVQKSMDSVFHVCTIPLVFVINSQTTGLLKLQNQIKFGITPNPACDYIRITGGLSDHDLTIYDQLGRLALTTKLSDNNFTVDIDKLSKGIYLVVLNNGRTAATKKLIIE